MNLSLDLQTSRRLAARHPSALTPQELGAVLDAAVILDSYITVAREVAEKQIADGKPVEGWELVATSGKRTIPDTVKAARQLAPLLKSEKILECSNLAIGKVQEAIKEAEGVSAARAKEILADYLKGNIIKGSGGKKLKQKTKTVEVTEIEE